MFMARAQSEMKFELKFGQNCSNLDQVELNYNLKLLKFEFGLSYSNLNLSIVSLKL